jgi:putative flippase GtrA
MVLNALKSRVPHSFWRFALVGIGGLVVDMAILYVGLWGLELSWFWAKVFSFLAAATFTWGLNRHYTFGKSNKSLFVEWASFLATNAFGGFVNFSVYSAVVTQFYPYVWLPAVATGMGSLSGLFFNYLSYKHLVFNQTSKLEIVAKDSWVCETPPFPHVFYLITFLVCMAFGAVALWLGTDASWDIRNYHWYNGWAFVNGLTGRDWLVSQLASFYNPAVDVPYALAVGRLPARAIGFALGMAHGLNFLPLSAIAWHLSTLANPRHRLYVSAAIAMVGICGAGGISEVGLLLYDNVLSLGVLTSILIVVANWDKIAQEPNLASIGWTIAAGISVGLVFGLNQPLVIFCVGLTTAFLVADITVLRRIGAIFCLGIGVLIGFTLSGGYWAVHLWETFGNPFFPYFNQFFQSHWASPIPYR